jgi:hypothetical protein
MNFYTDGSVWILPSLLLAQSYLIDNGICGRVKINIG